MLSSLQMYGYTYTKRFQLKIVPDPSSTRDGLLFSLCSHGHLNGEAFKFPYG